MIVIKAIKAREGENKGEGKGSIFSGETCSQKRLDGWT